MALKNFIKKNLVLVIGLALPVLLVIAFFFASVLPKSMAAPPQYEMLFSTTRYDYQNPPPYNVDFFVKNDTLKARVSRNTLQPHQHYMWKKLMAYNGKTQSSREIPYDITKVPDPAHGAEIVFEELKGMKVDNSTKAPDGYEFRTSARSGSFFHGLFWGGGYRSGSRVSKGAASFRVSDSTDGYPYYEVQFLGWIIPPGKEK